jgi:NifU-like protein involved in Fe-S cluster formation
MPAEALPPTLREHFDRPRHVGAPEGAGLRGEARNEACGDILVLWLRVGGSPARVEAAGWKAQGCPATLATASAACEVLPGLPADSSLPARLEGAHAAAFGVARVEAARRAIGG